MGKDGILGNTSLGRTEAERISNVLLDAIDSANVSGMANLILEFGGDLPSRIAQYVKEMESLERELKAYFITAFSYEDLVKQEQKKYTNYKLSQGADMQKIEDMWINLVLLADQAEQEFRRVNSLKEVEDIKRKIQQLYIDYEEVILALGSIIAPTSMPDSDFEF